MKEYCGIFGIFGHPEASELTTLGLHALQHRGEESSGIASGDGDRLHIHTGMGHVADVFGGLDISSNLPGHLAIGHNRYSTTGSDTLSNSQPFIAQFRQGSIAVAHNGNLINTTQIREELEEEGAIFQTTSDSEIVLHLIARARKASIVDRIQDALAQVRGAFSLLLCTEQKLIAARDPYGFRPLCLGRLGDAWVIASESCALDIISARYIRDIEPGELVVVDENGLRTISHSSPSDMPFAFSNTSIFRALTASSLATMWIRPDASSVGSLPSNSLRTPTSSLPFQTPATLRPWVMPTNLESNSKSV